MEEEVPAIVKDPTVSLAYSKGRRTLDRVEGFSTRIGPDNVLRGGLSGPGHIVVMGRVEGDSEIQGTLVIGDGGVWVGDIVAHNILIAGRLEGGIRADGKVEIVSTARVYGSITSPVIAIAEGAIHEGEMHMAEVKHFTGRRESE